MKKLLLLAVSLVLAPLYALEGPALPANDRLGMGEIYVLLPASGYSSGDGCFAQSNVSQQDAYDQALKRGDGFARNLAAMNLDKGFLTEKAAQSKRGYGYAGYTPVKSPQFASKIGSAVPATSSDRFRLGFNQTYAGRQCAEIKIYTYLKFKKQPLPVATPIASNALPISSPTPY